MRAILFDLDGTLLDIDLGAFLQSYFAQLRVAAERLPVGQELDVMEAIMSSTQAMMGEHRGETNREVFYAEFRQRTGVDLDAAWEVFERFYEDVFPSLGDGMGPHEGARRAVETALEHGYKVAIATNPIFPLRAVEHRLAWAGLGDIAVDLVTSYENMHSCKPYPAYFAEVAELLDVRPHDCLMVGDDRALDMPAAGIGMKTFYVGPHADTPCDFRGTMNDLAELIPRLRG